jgi:hypothetical protein
MGCAWSAGPRRTASAAAWARATATNTRVHYGLIRRGVTLSGWTIGKPASTPQGGIPWPGRNGLHSAVMLPAGQDTVKADDYYGSIADEPAYR